MQEDDVDDDTVEDADGEDDDVEEELTMRMAMVVRRTMIPVNIT